MTTSNNNTLVLEYGNFIVLSFTDMSNSVNVLPNFKCESTDSSILSTRIQTKMKKHKICVYII